MQELLRFLKRWAAEFEDQIVGFENSLTGQLERLQRELYEYLETAVLDIDTENGVIKNTPRNIRRYIDADQQIAAFNRSANMEQHMARFAGTLMEAVPTQSRYFAGIGLRLTQDNIQASGDMLRAVLGIGGDGTLLAGGYLDRLLQADQLRAEVANYVSNSVASGRSFREYRAGLKQLILGGQGVNGALVQYWQQYAYDTYNRSNELVSKFVADEMGLNYFIYQGSIIDTTRPFCSKKAGKVFSRAEALRWKNDPDLIDKKTVAQYNPFIDRGRYNCRHFLQWISDELAFELRPELKKD